MDNQISFFRNIKEKQCSPIYISDLLKEIKDGKYRLEIENIRKEKDKKKQTTLKLSLPAVTVSGIFNNSHSGKDLLEPSGLIQIDIDDVNDSELRRALENDLHTFSCFLSPTGTGLKLIVKIDPNHHLESFKALESYFKSKFQLIIDPKCKDIGRLMFVSYDENIYINPFSQVFSIAMETENKAIKSNKAGKASYNDQASRKADVEHLIGEIERNSIDITSGYDNWLKIGFAFASYFLESGREYFHRVSKFNADYSESETDLQFDKCLNGNGNGITLSTFFQIVKDNGLTIRKTIIQKVRNHKVESVKKLDVEKESEFARVEQILKQNFNFRYNEVSGEVEYKQIEEQIYKVVNEDNIYRFLQHNFISFSQAKLTSLLRSDFVIRYNPFVNYFENLPEWHKEKDFDHIENLANYVVAEDQERFNLHLKKMLVRTIACALDDSVFNKHAFILVHDQQNSGKSTFCRFLCPPALKGYFTENLTIDKDGQICLSENILINLDELSTISKFDINYLKSMFSKDKVKVRRPYDRRATTSNRRVSFIGSTNKNEFLTDETGSVRWLCFKILGINWNYQKEVDIDLVYSQAYSLYVSGFKYQLSQKEIAENEIANEQHQQTTPEKELIQELLEPRKKGDPDAQFMTATNIFELLTIKTSNHIFKLNIINIGKALKSLGFEQSQKFNGNHNLKGYYVKSIDPH